MIKFTDVAFALIYVKKEGRLLPSSRKMSLKIADWSTQHVYQGSHSA